MSSPPGLPAPATGQTQAPAQSSLPADVKAWRRDHYYEARRAGDPRLKEAVTFLGKKFSLKATGNEKSADQAATLLLKVLKGDLPPQEPAATAAPAAGGMSGYPGGMEPPTSGPPPSIAPPGMPGSGTEPPRTKRKVKKIVQEYSRQGTPTGETKEIEVEVDEPESTPPGMPGGYGGTANPTGGSRLTDDTIKAIVEAFWVNGGKVARESLAGILAGTVASDSDAAATKAVLEALLESGTPASEATLLTAITQPDSIRPKPKTETSPSTGVATPPAGTVSPPDSSSMSPPSMTPPPPMSSDPSMMSSGYPGMGGMQGGKLSAADLQTLALAVAKPIAKQEFRVKLATALTEKKTAEEFRGALQRFLLDSNPENLAAQFILLKGDAIDAAAKATIGSYLTTYSSQALASLLGVPTLSLKGQQGAAAGAPVPMSGMPPSGPDAAMSSPPSIVPPTDASTPTPYMPPSSSYPGMGPGSTGAPQGISAIELAKQYAKDPDLAYRVGSQLWGGDFVGLVTSQLDEAPSLAAGASKIVLASTMPTDAVRAKLYEAIEKHWQEGPAALQAAGLGGAVLNDPGLLAIFKSLPRRDASQDRLTPLQMRARERRSSQGGAGGDPGTGAGQPGADDTRSRKKFGAKKPKAGEAAEPAAPAASQPMSGQPTPGQGVPGQQGGKSAEYLWMDASETLARAMCEQYAAAAKAAAEKGINVDKESRPIELPATANVTAEYHLDWPKGLAQPGALSSASPSVMTVHYVRLEQETSPVKIFGYFKRRMMRPVEHPATTGYWMESFRPLPKSDRKLSVDVLVTRKADLAPKQPGAAATPGVLGMPGAPGAPDAGAAPPSSGPYGAAGQQPGQRERTEWAEKNEVSELVVEILTVEVKSPSPPDEQAGAEDEEEGGSEKTPGKSKARTIE